MQSSDFVLFHNCLGPGVENRMFWLAFINLLPTFARRWESILWVLWFLFNLLQPLARRSCLNQPFTKCSFLAKSCYNLDKKPSNLTLLKLSQTALVGIISRSQKNWNNIDILYGPQLACCAMNSLWFKIAQKFAYKWPSKRVTDVLQNHCCF